MNKITKAVIPAAGFGTRFLPATKAVPKEMLPIVDIPTIQYIAEEALESGIRDILIVTGRGKEAIMNHFDSSYELEDFLERGGKEDILAAVRRVSRLCDVHFIRQKRQLGLGHAVLYAKSFAAGEPFAVMLGDDLVANKDKPCLKQLIDRYDELGATVVGVQRVGMENVSKYGIVDGEKIGERLYRVRGMVEKPKREDAPGDAAILARYVITPGIFECLETIPRGAGGEYQLTDALVELSKKEPVYAYDFEGERYDVGNKQGFLRATVEYALARPDLAPEFSRYLKEVVKTKLS